MIIWDDASTDCSLAIAQQFAHQDSRIHLIPAPHQGLTGSLRSALVITRGEYLAWVDSDDWLAPTALAQTLAVLQHQPHVGLVYTHYLTMNQHDQVLGLGRRCHLPYSPKRLLVNFMVFHFRLVRRSVFEQAGEIDPIGELVPDYDLCLRVADSAVTAAVILLPGAPREYVSATGSRHNSPIVSHLGARAGAFNSLAEMMQSNSQFALFGCSMNTKF